MNRTAATRRHIRDGKIHIEVHDTNCTKNRSARRSVSRILFPHKEGDGHRSWCRLSTTLNAAYPRVQTWRTTTRRFHASPTIWPCSGWGLPCHTCYQLRGGLLPHRFTLACAGKPAIGGLLSAALSVASRRPAVSRHPALRSSDFPPLQMI
jgi:hypothetical protein